MHGNKKKCLTFSGMPRRILIWIDVIDIDIVDVVGNDNLTL